MGSLLLARPRRRAHVVVLVWEAFSLRKMLTLAYPSLLFGLLLTQGALAQNVGQWNIPEGTRPNFTDVYNNGNSITWSWQGMNRSMSDLWLTSFDPTASYALRVASNINITEPGTLPWTITVTETQIDIDDRFCLRFVLTGTDIFPLHADQFPSPAFLILKRGQTLSATTASSPANVRSSSVGATSAAATNPFSTTSSSPSISATPHPAIDPPRPGLSAGAKAGIAVGVAAVLVIILGLSFWVMRLYRRVKAASNHHSKGIIPEYHESMPTNAADATPTIKYISGVHEVVGDRRQPTEMSTKREEKVIYEMAG